MQPAKKDFPVPTSPQMRSQEAVAFSVNLVIVFRIPHFRNFFAGKQDDPACPSSVDIPRLSAVVLCPD